jgi:hypothetical protein
MKQGMPDRHRAKRQKKGGTYLFQQGSISEYSTKKQSKEEHMKLRILVMSLAVLLIYSVVLGQEATQ